MNKSKKYHEASIASILKANSLNHGLSISNQGNLRSVCVDKLFFNPDGTIKTVVQTGSKVKN